MIIAPRSRKAILKAVEEHWEMFEIPHDNDRHGTELSDMPHDRHTLIDGSRSSPADVQVVDENQHPARTQQTPAARKKKANKITEEGRGNTL